MILQVEYEDGLAPYLRLIIDREPKWLGSAMKSAGYWSQKEIKKGIRSRAPGGKAYRQLMPDYIRQAIDRAMGHASRDKYIPLGKLINAVGYDKTRVSEGVVTVGWLSASAVMIGTKQEKGFFNIVSERMRHAFARAGYPIPPGRSQIPVVARPTYEPMQKVIASGAPAVIEQRLLEYLTGSTSRSTARSARTYRVYS